MAAWLHGCRYPEGHVVRQLGPVADLKAESAAVLEQAGITWQVHTLTLTLTLT
ncbi:MAG: hypothetical protein ACT6T3_22420, partial [Agrobacterium sp.]|uniref:hypothetical protein n=1 Tax=Agrobacterium sp. TaxID=361 RepID=UPI004033268B